MTSKGIPAAAIEFFVELETNNNREWWATNRHRYEGDVRAPFEALLTDLGDRYQPWRIYRPHRDTRFAHNKAPYKDFIGAVTQLPAGNGYFVQISAKGLLLGSGYPMMAPDQLTTFRQAVADDTTGTAFVALLQQASVAGLRVTGGRYDPLKRNPKGFPADHVRGEWLRWKGVELPQRVGMPSWLHRSGAAKQLRALIMNGHEVTGWLDTHVGPSSLTPEEIWGR
jgi:uncharacterized protein (TIGR02453 family)